MWEGDSHREEEAKAILSFLSWKKEEKALDTILAQNLKAAEKHASTDRCAKNLIANNNVAAIILKFCTSEFKDIDVDYIRDQAIGDISISQKAVHQDHMDRPGRENGNGKILLLNSESSSMQEGTIFYDVRFRAKVPGGGDVSIMINIELQNDDHPGYNLATRGIYYCSRMISSQYGTIFDDESYQNLEKVYSIWICPLPAKKRENMIERFFMSKEVVAGKSFSEKKDYDKMEVLVIYLGGSIKKVRSIQDFLYTIFTQEMSAEEKINRLSSVYGIKMTKKLKREVREMCNLGMAYEAAGIEKGMKKGIAKGIAKGIEKGIEKGKFEELNDLVRKGIISIETAAETKGMTVEEFRRKVASLGL